MVAELISKEEGENEHNRGCGSRVKERRTKMVGMRKEFFWDEVIHHKIIIEREDNQVSLIRDGIVTESFKYLTPGEIPGKITEVELTRVFNEMVANITVEVENARRIGNSDKL